MEENTINVVEEKKETTKNHKNRKKIVAIIVALAIVSGSGVATYLKSKFDKIDNLLSLNNVSIDGDFEALQDEFGEIPGWMVDLYLSNSSEYKNEDIVRIGDYFISESGEPFDNTINGKSFIVYTDSGEEISISNFDGKEKLINGAPKNIDPISKEELKNDYVLEFGVSGVSKQKKKDGTIIYKAKHGPVLRKKPLK